MKKVLSIIGNVISWALIVCVAIITVNSIVLKAKGEVPKVFGYSMYIVATGSMEPEIMVGDVILAKEYDSQTLKEGDVITYLGKVGSFNGKMVTHQIIKINYDVNNEIVSIQTKGLANNESDPLISESQVMSIMVTKLTVVTFILGIVKKPIGFIVLVFIPLAYLVVVEMLNLKKQIKEKKEEEKENGEEASK